MGKNRTELSSGNVNKPSDGQNIQAQQSGENGDSGENSDLQEPSSDEGQNVSAVMDQAELLAMQYDYDGAIALLKGLSGAEAGSAAGKITEYEEKKAQCVAVDVTRVPHIFFHSLINDDRAFKADLVGADRV